MRVMHHVPLSELTTFKIGGCAETVTFFDTKEELVDAFVSGASPDLIVGGGSNILAPDEGVRAVFVPRFSRILFDENERGVFVTAEAGVSWDALVAGAVERGWWGLENLSGIPGTVGGAVVQNVGAYGAVLSNSLVSIEVFDRVALRRTTVIKDDGRFGYRTSLFKRAPLQYVVLSATFSLSAVPRPCLSYHDLAVRFGSGDPAIRDIRDAVCEIRAKKFPDLSRFGTAGSFFLNPIVSEDDAHTAGERFPGMPLFTLPEGGVKVPLAWILDHVVHAKGMREGGAFVWPEQALVIAAEPGTRERDVRTLSLRLMSRVYELTNIHIHPEVCIVRE